MQDFIPSGLPEQMPMPFAAAQAYEETVLRWSSVRAPGVVAERNIAYGDDAAQRYDIYSTAALRATGDAPVLVFWHGGGWTNGYKEYVAFMADAVTRLGMVLVAPGYRLAPAHRLPAAFEDAQAVLGHLASHVGALGGDARRTYLAGHSAGAHLAALVALRHAELVRVGADPDMVKACLPISGIMDLHHPAPPLGSMEERVYTLVLRDEIDDARMSPLCWAAGATVPIWLSHGDGDSARVIRSNRRLHAMLSQGAAPTRLDVEVGLDHFATHTYLREPAAAWYRRLRALLRMGEG